MNKMLQRALLRREVVEVKLDEEEHKKTKMSTIRAAVNKSTALNKTSVNSTLEVIALMKTKFRQKVWHQVTCFSHCKVLHIQITIRNTFQNEHFNISIFFSKFCWTHQPP